ncbi:acetyl-CoA synthetase-like protein [Polyporus arcularius HHB13444]|uniref:Acetyl-CoA synthetase-like protein n=1 Tax=Polyporus arcularius HHB13444 TaxID=1314778 RepID=A0A5C3P500_9APHY|nr:acetyl-CoA synthetase-like protein [Polyporus arcularius HHB13444]
MTIVPSMLTPQGVNVPTFSPPPLDGSATLPEWVPHHAKHSPQHAFAVYTDEAGDLQTVYYPQVWRAVKNAMVLLSRQQVGHGPLTSDTPAQPRKPAVVGILAVSDSLSYIALVWAIMSRGDTPFPISTRNSALAVAHLVKQTGIQHLFVSSDPAMQRLAHEAAELRAADGARVQTFQMPTFEDLYLKDEGVDFEVQKRGLDEIVMIMHSSGSTAFPKPIPLTNRRVLEWATVPHVGELDLGGTRMAAHALPVFHAMGIAMYKWALSSGLTVACFRPTLPPVIPTPDSLLNGIISCKCDTAFSVPSMVEAWSQTLDDYQVLVNLKALMYAGAPMNKAIGDKMAQAGVNLVPLYGATESAVVSFGVYDRSSGRRAPEMWDWFHISRRVAVHMVPYDEEERLYECIVLETPEYHPSVITTAVNGVPAFETKDLLQRHPDDPTLWTVFGRTDDQLILSTGEKTNPGPLETILMQDPHVLAVVMFGRGRLQNGVLIQPKEPFDPEDEGKLAAFRNKIWPTIEKVNHYAPAHSRIFKEMVIVTSPSKPFEFTAKATPRRQACINAYSQEIDAAYNKMQESSQPDIAPPEHWTRESVQGYIRTIVDKVMSTPVGEDDDLFQYGCDSLQSTWIRNTILHGIRESAHLPPHDIPLTFVYSNPTIRALTEYVYGLVAEGPSASKSADALNAKVASMVAMANKYKLSPVPSSGTGATGANRPTHGRTVLLTGTTGRLGSHALAQLLQSPDVVKVYALNREKSGSDAALLERQRAQFKLFGLDVGLLSSDKVSFRAVQFEKERLGLEEARYRELSANVDTVIHNAWRVDFNLTLPSFEPLLAGLRNLLELSRQAKQNGREPRFAFISSISVFRGYSGSVLAPEAPIEDPRIAAGGGYSESKWVAEQVVASASGVGIDTIVVRVGQLSGDTRIGGWSVQEWVPALLGASQKIGCVPSRNENLTWLPVDTAAAALLELLAPKDSAASDGARTEYAHLVCPTPTPWDAVFGEYAKRLGLPLVPIGEWVQRLESYSRSNTAAEGGAGLHLLEFFTKGLESGVEDVLSTEKTVARSRVLAEAKPVDEKDVERSLKFWVDVGAIKSTS